MKYSKFDLILVFVSVFQFISLLLWAYNFNDLNLISNIIIMSIEILLFYYNPIVITHNFLHCPFFKSKQLNKMFSIFNSAPMGLPVLLYRHHHLIHHKYNNNFEDPSSTFLFGKNNKQEHWISYCSLSIFRDGISKAFKRIFKRKEEKQLYMELGFMFLFLITLAYIDLKWFFVCYLPLFYIGYFLAHMENYFEHYKATDITNRFANSVSYNNKLYNIIMFNEGHHQVHHIFPQSHWTKREKETKENKEILIKNNSYFAKYPPLLGFLE